MVRFKDPYRSLNRGAGCKPDEPASGALPNVVPELIPATSHHHNTNTLPQSAFLYERSRDRSTTALRLSEYGLSQFVKGDHSGNVQLYHNRLEPEPSNAIDLTGEQPYHAQETTDPYIPFSSQIRYGPVSPDAAGGNDTPHHNLNRMQGQGQTSPHDGFKAAPTSLQSLDNLPGYRDNQPTYVQAQLPPTSRHGAVPLSQPYNAGMGYRLSREPDRPLSAGPVGSSDPKLLEFNRGGLANARNEGTDSGPDLASTSIPPIKPSRLKPTWASDRSEQRKLWRTVPDNVVERSLPLSRERSGHGVVGSVNSYGRCCGASRLGLSPRILTDGLVALKSFKGWPRLLLVGTFGQAYTFPALYPTVFAWLHFGSHCGLYLSRFVSHPFRLAAFWFTFIGVVRCTEFGQAYTFPALYPTRIGIAKARCVLVLPNDAKVQLARAELEDQVEATLTVLYPQTLPSDRPPPKGPTRQSAKGLTLISAASLPMALFRGLLDINTIFCFVLDTEVDSRPIQALILEAHPAGIHPPRCICLGARESPTLVRFIISESGEVAPPPGLAVLNSKKLRRNPAALNFRKARDLVYKHLGAWTTNLYLTTALNRVAELVELRWLPSDLRQRSSTLLGIAKANAAVQRRPSRNAWTISEKVEDLVRLILDNSPPFRGLILTPCPLLAFYLEKVVGCILATAGLFTEVASRRPKGFRGPFPHLSGALKSYSGGATHILVSTFECAPLLACERFPHLVFFGAAPLVVYLELKACFTPPPTITVLFQPDDKLGWMVQALETGAGVASILPAPRY
ncbi:hypothetical protein L0F63_005454 [Massospora cicadina]|nr:hypothetical protein L0F63_005454 [Massospora cicadina]